ncbi:MAG: cation:proton antiporter [Candidatus Altiarchaeales archaeon]|nr:MAG: cation:proton antiporter [Candidatus Altiarchaeales archaeon]
MELMDFIVTALLFGGTFFFTTATLGLLRFPDLFTRLHATGKGDTLGVGLILTGLVIYLGLSPITLKIIIIMTFILLTSPVGTHCICRAVYNQGIKPWKRR